MWFVPTGPDEGDVPGAGGYSYVQRGDPRSEQGDGEEAESHGG